MKRKIIFIILFTFFFLCGCVEKQEVDDLTIATAIGIDINEEGEIEFTAQVLNSNAVGDRPMDVVPGLVVSETGRTTQEALRKLTTMITDKLFFSHFVVLIIGEELAKKGILPYVNFFAINQETLHRFNIIIARGCKANDVLKIVSLLEHIPSMSIDGKFNASTEFYGISKYYTNDEVINDIKSDGIHLALGSIQIIGDVEEGSDLENRKKTEAKTNTKVSTIGIFKEDKLVAWFDEDESLGYNYLLGKIKNSFVVVTKGDGILATVEINDSSSKWKLFVEEGKIKFKLTIKYIANIVEDMSGSTSNSPVYMHDILNRTNYEIRMKCEKALNKAKEYKTDIFGFGRYIYRWKYKLWEEIKTVYDDDIFPNLDVEIVVDGEMTRVKP